MKPIVAQRVTFEHVVRARRLMRQGWGLWEIAEHLHVGRGDLDLALWENFASRPAPVQGEITSRTQGRG